MKSNMIYNKKALGLDYNVWRVMLTVIIISVGLLSYKLIDKKKCTPFSFRIKHISNSDSVYFTGETLFFTASTDNPDIAWDFGDNSPKAEGKFVTHKFYAPGKYYVTASINSECDIAHQITISPRKVQLNPDSLSTGNKIVGRSTTVAGSTEIFICLAEAETYEWTITDHPEIRDNVRRGREAQYSFLLPGKYTIQVELNNDRRKRFLKEILVESKSGSAEPVIKKLLPPELPPIAKVREEQEAKKVLEEEKKAQEATIPITAPVEKEPAPRVPMRIPEDRIFLDFLKRVQTGRMDLNEFDKYFCTGITPKVKINGKNLESFAGLVEELKKSKKITLQNVQLQRDENNCIFLIDLEYKKKGWLSF